MGSIVLAVTAIGGLSFVGWALVTGRLVSRRQHKTVLEQSEKIDRTSHEVISFLERVIPPIARMEKTLNTVGMRAEQLSTTPPPLSNQPPNGAQG